MIAADDVRDDAMTVSQLIGVLSGYPADMRVVVNGYEEGYDDLSPRQSSVVRVALDTGVNDWEGRHGETDETAPGSAESGTIVDALVLRRVSN